MEQTNQKMTKSYEDFTSFVVAVSNYFGLVVYEVTPYIFEVGSETVPSFRLMWSPDREAPIISFHIQTRNSDAIQIYTASVGISNNLVLAESYYTSVNGETFAGEDAEIASQMDLESQVLDTTTDTKLPEDMVASFICSTPIYHALDPRAKEQIAIIKKRKQGLGNL